MNNKKQQVNNIGEMIRDHLKNMGPENNLRFQRTGGREILRHTEEFADDNEE